MTPRRRARLPGGAHDREPVERDLVHRRPAERPRLEEPQRARAAAALVLDVDRDVVARDRLLDPGRERVELGSRNLGELVLAALEPGHPRIVRSRLRMPSSTAPGSGGGLGAAVEPVSGPLVQPHGRGLPIDDVQLGLAAARGLDPALGLGQEPQRQAAAAGLGGDPHRVDAEHARALRVALDADEAHRPPVEQRQERAAVIAPGVLGRPRAPEHVGARRDLGIGRPKGVRIGGQRAQAHLAQQPGIAGPHPSDRHTRILFFWFGRGARRGEGGG